MQVEFRGWTADVDVDATRRAYALATAAAVGSPDVRNFEVARDAGLVFPPDAIELLTSLGVDPAHASELYLNGETDDGRFSYGGWFNVAGQLVADAKESTEIAPGLHLYPLAEGALVGTGFGDAPVFRIEFEASVPWVLPARL